MCSQSSENVSEGCRIIVTTSIFFKDLISYLGLLSSDAMDSETSLYIIDKTEVLASLLNADHIWVNKQCLRT